MSSAAKSAIESSLSGPAVAVSACETIMVLPLAHPAVEVNTNAFQGAQVSHLRRAQSESEPVRNLGERQILDISELKHLAIERRQLPECRLDRGTLLVAAYSALWIVLFVWVALVWRKQTALNGRLADLERVLDKAAADADAKAKK